MKFKNVFIVIFLISVFAVGTISSIDTVEAAKWKKYDSGTVKIQGKTLKYKTYIKGSKEMRMDMSSSGKILMKYYFTKTKTGIKVAVKDKKGKTINSASAKTKVSLKSYYKVVIRLLKNY
ncbi:MAG: hypothetical protein FWH54_00255 [Methanobrevibacter sp.]|nr:hypothetical protein [Methanobrevibacter sp.]